MLTAAEVAHNTATATMPTRELTIVVRTTIAPLRAKSHPARRCVRRHDSSLLSVHGVRTPMNQFDLIFGR